MASVENSVASGSSSFEVLGVVDGLSSQTPMPMESNNSAEASDSTQNPVTLADQHEDKDDNAEKEEEDSESDSSLDSGIKAKLKMLKQGILELKPKVENLMMMLNSKSCVELGQIQIQSQIQIQGQVQFEEIYAEPEDEKAAPKVGEHGKIDVGARIGKSKPEDGWAEKFAKFECNGSTLAFLILLWCIVIDLVTVDLQNRQSITSCSDAIEILPSPFSQKQTIYPHGNTDKVEVLCDFETDGGGWTIIQKRTSGPKQEFQKTWTEYQSGFGSLDKNFWIGLENIHALTKNGDQELRIELEDFEGEKKYAKYSNFSVSDASDFYRLTLSGFSGTAGDSMANPNYWATYLNNGMMFSTKDKDNDNWSGDCVEYQGGGGGWWFNNCGLSSLNGLYYEKGEYVPFGKGIYWWSWKGYRYSLAKTEMKIRTRK